MDIALQGGAGAAMVPEAARPMEQAFGAPGGGLQSGASVMPMSHAFPAQTPPDVGLTGVIDRVRADFESFRLRLERQKDPQLIDQTPAQAIEKLTESMDHAMRTQVDILELGLTLNAGLTATHQSQNSVKTLLEKA